jgi:hypothetical protein
MWGGGRCEGSAPPCARSIFFIHNVVTRRAGHRTITPPDRAHSTHTITNEGPSAVPMEHGLSGVFEWALAS